MGKSPAILADVGERPSSVSVKPRSKVLLVTHIAASVSVLGADLALLMLGLAGVSGVDAQLVYPAAHLLASRLLVPLAVLSLVTGVAIALRAGIFRHGWVAAKFAITAVLIIAATLVLVPGLQAAAVAASSDEALSRAAELRFAIVPAVASALLLLNVGLAIYKPARRGRPR